MLCHSEIVGHGAHPLCNMMENRKEGGKERLGEGERATPKREREGETETERGAGHGKEWMCGHNGQGLLDACVCMWQHWLLKQRWL